MLVSEEAFTNKSGSRLLVSWGRLRVKGEGVVKQVRELSDKGVEGCPTKGEGCPTKGGRCLTTGEWIVKQVEVLTIISRKGPRILLVIGSIVGDGLVVAFVFAA